MGGIAGLVIEVVVERGEEVRMAPPPVLTKLRSLSWNGEGFRLRYCRVNTAYPPPVAVLPYIYVTTLVLR